MAENVKATVIFAVVFIAVASAVIFGHAYFEARAYNRLTGAHVSTWDAVFLELRVQEQPRGD